MTKTTKVKIFLSFSASVIIVFTVAAGIHLIANYRPPESHESVAPENSPKEADATIPTRGSVPLFELPWKRTDGFTSADSMALSKESGHKAIGSGSSSSRSAVETTIPASLPMTRGVAAVPFANSGAKVQRLMFGQGGRFAKSPTSIGAQEGSNVGLIPPLQGTTSWNAQKLLGYYFHQICKDRAPTIKDWCVLAQSRPPGTEAYLNLPFGAGHFIVSACADQWGRVWIGTEGEGLWAYDPNASLDQQWHHFTTDDGLGDNYIYSLAVDRVGRVWSGHLNHGVSVYSGQRWQNYDVVGDGVRSLSGPIGERVFAIKTCPTDGDVWIATNAGLTRYSQANDTWSNYSCEEGLPSNNIDALAFDAAGDLFVGTQCNGIAISKSEDNYTRWQQVTGPDAPPITAMGTGLPTNSINDVLVARDGTFYAATTTGLAWSDDRGKTWQFCRGVDWAAKVRGLAGGVPRNWVAASIGTLAEDYVTSMAEDRNGGLYIGYRTRGCAFIKKRDGKFHMDEPSLEPYYVTCLAAGSAEIIAGTYDGGMQIANLIPKCATPCLSVSAALPSTAKAPTLAELNQQLRGMAAVPPAGSQDACRVLPLTDDWLTQGDWLGRYGRYWALLAAIDDPKRGYEWGAGPTPLPWKVDLGGPHRSTDYLRFWIGKFYTTDPRALEMPPVYMHSRVIHHLTTWEKNRRQAEWDDHGETYSPAVEGPGIILHVGVPTGIFSLSLYEVNDDAHNSVRNARRDFRVTMMKESIPAADNPEEASTVTLASSRVQNFWGGVYKRFMVKGPVQLAIRVDRTYSFNTVFNALLVDLPDERPVGYFLSASAWQSAKDNDQSASALQLKNWKSDPEAYAKEFDPAPSEFLASQKLIDRLQSVQSWNPEWWAIHQHSLAVRVARWAQANVGDKATPGVLALEATSLYQAGRYEQWEKTQEAMHRVTARQIEKSLRWDGITPDNSRLGYQTIAAYLAGESGHSSQPTISN